jgi:hypothetical protein
VGKAHFRETPGHTYLLYRTRVVGVVIVGRGNYCCARVVLLHNGFLLFFFFYRIKAVGTMVGWYDRCRHDGCWT